MQYTNKFNTYLIDHDQHDLTLNEAVVYIVENMTTEPHARCEYQRYILQRNEWSQVRYPGNGKIFAWGKVDVDRTEKVCGSGTTSWMQNQTTGGSDPAAAPFRIGENR